MADVIAMYKIVADVITTEADVIAFLFMVLADVIANIYHHVYQHVKFSEGYMYERAGKKYK